MPTDSVNENDLVDCSQSESSQAKHCSQNLTSAGGSCQQTADTNNNPLCGLVDHVDNNRANPIVYSIRSNTSYISPNRSLTTTMKPFSIPTFTTPKPLTPFITTPRPVTPFITHATPITSIQTKKPNNGSKKQLGERCLSAVDSCPENAHCVMNICACMPGYEPGNARCTIITENAAGKRNKYRDYGETCRLEEECKAGDCLDGRCECPPMSTLINKTCIYDWEIDKTARPGEYCDHDYVCSGGAICDRDVSRCICAADHWINGNSCVNNGLNKISMPGEQCTKNKRCISGSECINGMCQCSVGQHPFEGYCRPNAAKNAGIQLINGGALKFSAKSIIQRPRASKCPASITACQLPKCFCSQNGKQAPGGLSVDETPQFVVLTFDDAVNGRTLPDYHSLFDNNKYVNPNGCPIKGTFFVSHEWTNYDGVYWLYKNGHELASNSITQISLQEKSLSRWLNEMDGERRIIAKFGNVNEGDIVGMRAPDLGIGGNQQFEMMERAGFLYDNSITSDAGPSGEPYWPQTLDYALAWPCADKHCPKNSYKGIWEIPMNQFYRIDSDQRYTGQHSSILRAAVNLNDTVEDIFYLLHNNFESAYNSNRAPYILTLTADFLQLNAQNTGMLALQRFLDQITTNKDVYIVTLKQLIEWMQDPVPLSKMHQFSSRFCNPMQHPNDDNGLCKHPNKCMYKTPNLNSPEHQFISCNPCPERYPWVDNPLGKLRL